MAAPATAIIGYDLDFAAPCPSCAPHNQDAKNWSTIPSARASRLAMRNARLQGGYFIIAARALGLDCGPMSGFDNDGVDKEFFAGTSIKSNFLCNLGYGDPPACSRAVRACRFDEACRLE